LSTPSADTLGNAPVSALSERLSARRPGSTASAARSGAAPARPSRSSCRPCTLPLPWHDTPYHDEVLPWHGPGVPQLRSGPGGAPSGPRSVFRNAISTSASVPWAAAGRGDRRAAAANATATATARAARMWPGGRGRAMGKRAAEPSSSSGEAGRSFTRAVVGLSASSGLWPRAACTHARPGASSWEEARAKLRAPRVHG